MQISWVISTSASGFYSANQMLRGREFADQMLSKSLIEPVEQFRIACETWQVNPVELTDHLTAKSAEEAPLRPLVETAIRKIAGVVAGERLSGIIFGPVQQILAATRDFKPQMLDELELRAKPVRELWEAAGPGLLFALKKKLGEPILAESASVTLVYPAMGGGGVAHSTYNRVSFEAVLANTVFGLPEVVRLAWLLAQLQFDLPEVQGRMSRSRTLSLAPLAVLPAVLEAAHDLEVGAPLEQALPTALQAWRLGPVDAESLLAWWETYLVERPSWPTALFALEALLAASEPGTAAGCRNGLFRLR